MLIYDSWKMARTVPIPFTHLSKAVCLLSELDLDAWVTPPTMSESFESWSCMSTETDVFFIRYFSSRTNLRQDRDSFEAYPLMRRVEVVSNILVLKLQDGFVVDVEEDDLAVILETVADIW